MNQFIHFLYSDKFDFGLMKESEVSELIKFSMQIDSKFLLRILIMYFLATYDNYVKPIFNNFY